MRTVSDLMTHGPLIIDRQQSLAEATTRMELLRLRHLPVIDGGGQLAGMLSLEDLLRHERGNPSVAPDAALVADAMSREPLIVAPDAPAAEVARAMVERRVDAAVVVEHGRIVGILTATDALRAVADGAAGEAGTRAWPKRILCPIDFSDGSREAIRMALDVARASEGVVTLFHAYAVPISAVSEMAAVGMHSLEKMDRDTDAALAAWRDEHRAARGPEITVAKGLGDDADSIVRHARDNRFDLIVIGTHGRTGMRRALLGSVTENVVRRATCPVLVCRRGEPPASSKELQS